MEKHIAKLLSFGNGGHSIEYTGGCHLSGYDRPETIKLTPELEGVPVLDKRPAIETEAGYRWVFRGPMVNVNIESGIDRCPEPSPIFAGAMAESGNGYGTLLALQTVHRASDKQEAGPLDSVSVADYIAGWMRHGARVGVVENGAIVWSN